MNGIELSGGGGITRVNGGGSIIVEDVIGRLQKRRHVRDRHVLGHSRQERFDMAALLQLQLMQMLLMLLLLLQVGHRFHHLYVMLLFGDILLKLNMPGQILQLENLNFIFFFFYPMCS